MDLSLELSKHGRTFGLADTNVATIGTTPIKSASLDADGAWDKLLLVLSEQQAQHLVDSTTTPPLAAPGLAAMLKLAKQIVIHPRHRSLRAVDWAQFDRFKRRVEELVPREPWEEVVAILSTSSRHFVDGGPKIGNGRRPDRESES